MSEKAKPDYDQITTVDEVEAEIQKHKDRVCRKAKERGQTKQNKKEALAGYNEVLKEVEEELDFHLAVIDELGRHKKAILAGHAPKTKLQSV